MSRITMSVVDSMVAMSDGNPGALTAMVEIVKQAEKVDPDSLLGPLGPLSTLDHMECYGSRIWMLYKDVCGHSVVFTMAALRAVQLGLLPSRNLDKAIDGDKTMIDTEGWLRMVREELPDFAKAA